MRKKRLIISLCAAAAALLVFAAVLFDALSNKKNVEKTGIAMGSVVTVKLYGKSYEDCADEITDSIENEENSRISRYKDTSEVFLLNKNGKAELSSHTADIIKRAVKISEDSFGAFDPTVGRLSSLWNFDENVMTVPADEDIKSALEGTGSEKLKINGNTVALGKNQEIDLGALGKGLACDIAAEILEKNNIKGAVVSVGGSVLAYGKNPSSDFWTIGIRTPEPDDTSAALKLKIHGTAFISTSGNYEKCFIKDNVLYHHILSPETGYPADSSLKSVTVVSDSGLVSDALSTACFVLGKENSSEVLKKYNAEAVFIDNENNVYITDGIFANVEAAKNGYALYEYGK